jgi:hypothetical protein
MSTTSSPRFTEAQAAALIERAEAAAKVAFEAAKPTAMIVGTPRDLIGSLLGGDGGGFDTSQPIHYVSEGACGFAWVNVRPANGSFARRAKAVYAKRNPGRSYQVSKGYYGGMEIRPDALGMSQSIDRKSAACSAYAQVLREAGINAFADSRLD